MWQTHEEIKGRRGRKKRWIKERRKYATIERGSKKERKKTKGRN
jgi:hypothetical protein